MNTTDLSLEDPYAVEQQAIQRRMQLANLLMQKGASDAPVYSNKAGAMKLLAGLLSGVQMREAEGQQKELAGRKQEAERGEMESIITASQGQDPKAVMKQLLASSNPQHRQMALAMALKGPGKVEWKDGGDKWLAVDERGNPTGQTMPKGVTPDARYGKETVSADKVYDTNTVSASARYAKDTVGAEAKLADERERSEGAANRGVQLQGQASTDARARDANSIAAGNKAREDLDGIRKEFNALPEVKSYKEAMPVLQSAKKAPDTPQGDLALVYAVGKVLDPNSVVREGEMSLVLKSGSMMERLMGTARMNFAGKGRLSPEMRQKLTSMMDQRAAEYEAQYGKARSTFEGIAKTRGYDPGQIFTDSPAADARAVKRTGTLNGRKVVEYSDGSVEYAD